MARLGKKVLRPGGLALSKELIANAGISGAKVVEFAPGVGRTAELIMGERPSGYVGVDQDADAARIVSLVVEPLGRCVQADAQDTGLRSESAEVVVGEAMLSMHGDRAKRAIVQEAARLLPPGGRFAIHELGVRPDDAPAAVKDEIRVALARSLRVNARPLTVGEWAGLLRDAGFEVVWTRTAPMALLRLPRVVADEGFVPTLRIMARALRNRELRSRVLAMRRTFAKHADRLCGVAIVAKRV